MQSGSDQITTQGVSALNDVGFDTSAARAFARQRHEVIVAEVRRLASSRQRLARCCSRQTFAATWPLDTRLLSKFQVAALRDEHSTDEPVRNRWHHCRKHAARGRRSRSCVGIAIGINV